MNPWLQQLPASFFDRFERGLDAVQRGEANAVDALRRALQDVEEGQSLRAAVEKIPLSDNPTGDAGRARHQLRLLRNLHTGRRVQTLVGASLAGVLLMVWVSTTADMFSARASADWPSTTARVIESRPLKVRSAAGGRPTTSFYELKLAYVFEVGGRAVTGTRLAFDQKPRSTEQEMQALADRYPVGGTVTVSYNPAKPENAVLLRGESTHSRTIPLLPLFFGAVAGFFGLVRLREARLRVVLPAAAAGLLGLITLLLTP